MSENRNVSVPVGGGAGLGAGIGSAGPFAILAAYSGQFARFGQLPGRARDSGELEIRLTDMADPPILAFANDTEPEHTQCGMPRKFLLLGALAAFHAAIAWAANGDILERKPIATGADAAFVAERVVYESDGLRIVGFLAYPKGAPEGAARLPCVLFNRGGNRDFGANTPANFLGSAQPRHGVGLRPVRVELPRLAGIGRAGRVRRQRRERRAQRHPRLRQLAFADRDRIGMWGHSRGGMMTYIALTKTDRIRAAVIGAGITDLERMIALRPEMDTEVAAQTVPDWKTNRARAIEARSAVRFVDRLPANVPILLVHGTADMRVDPRDSMDMARALFASRKPVSLLLVEGADHRITRTPRRVLPGGEGLDGPLRPRSRQAAQSDAARDLTTGSTVRALAMRALRHRRGAVIHACLKSRRKR